MKNNLEEKLKIGIEPYGLGWLNSSLKALGIDKVAFNYCISDDNSKIHIEYLDWLLNIQYMAISRTSRHCYRISVGEKLYSARTVKATVAIVSSLFDSIILDNDYFSVLSVQDYYKLKLGKITYKEKSMIVGRLADKQRKEK